MGRPATRGVDRAEHIADLLVRELLVEVGQDVAQIGVGDEAVVVTV